MPPFSEIYLALESTPGAARQAARDWLTREGCAHVGSDAELVVSELVTNAVVHAWDPIRVSLSRSEDALLVEVFDASPRLPRRTVRRDLQATSGRGLDMVAALAEDWGCERETEGKQTWARLPLSRTEAG